MRPTETSADAAADSTTTRRRVLHAALAGGWLLRIGPVRAAGGTGPVFELVSEAEARREAHAAAAAPPPPQTRGLPAPDTGPMPALDVITPADEAAVTSPLRLEVVFRPAADARIVSHSFRVLYGVLKIDLTERLQPHARLSEDGVVVEGAQMPAGTHRLLLRVADDKGRTAEKGLVFRVTRQP